MLKMFSIFDHKALSYSRPFFCKTQGEATRMFMDEVNRPNPDNMLYNHPADFTLYYVGSFDEQTGEVLPEAPSFRIANGTEVQTLSS